MSHPHRVHGDGLIATQRMVSSVLRSNAPLSRILVITIFFAVKLNKAELPDWFDLILAGFVAFHVFMHLVLSVRLYLVMAHLQSHHVIPYSF